MVGPQEQYSGVAKVTVEQYEEIEEEWNDNKNYMSKIFKENIDPSVLAYLHLDEDDKGFLDWEKFVEGMKIVFSKSDNIENRKPKHIKATHVFLFKLVGQHVDLFESLEVRSI